MRSARQHKDLELWQNLRAVNLDFMLVQSAIEYGCAEHSIVDENGVGAKEIYEMDIKLSKVMKDMLVRVHAKLNHEEKLRQIRIVELVHNRESGSYSLSVTDVDSSP